MTDSSSPAIVAYEEACPLDSLTPYRQNPRQGDIGAIAISLQEHGQYRPIVANVGTHASVQREVLAGNHTVAAARQLGWATLAVTWVDVDDDTAARIVVVDNRSNDLAGYDEAELADLLAQLAATPRGLAGTGYDDAQYQQLLDQLRYQPGQGGTTLADRFGAPPFTLLDGRQGYWRDRKAEWMALGLAGEEGRAHLGSTVATPSINRGTGTGGSVFDPVLCELVYRWYCPPEGHVLDPFAGGVTRGAVAGHLAHPYTGVELRPEQVEANYSQLPTLHPAVTPTWLEGDSAQLPAKAPGAKAAAWQQQLWTEHPYDLLFTCPPYFDLEPYSTEQLDGSHLPTWDEFATWYRQLFARAAGLLAADRFAAIVVGEIRDKTTGTYRNLLGLTIDTLTSAGLAYFAEYVYVTPAGSLPIRTAAQFPTSRKPGKTHQNLLVFYKGNPATIRDTWPEVPEGSYTLTQPDTVTGKEDSP